MALKRTYKEALHFIRNPRKIFGAIWEELEVLDEKVDSEANSLVTSVASGEGHTQNQLNNAFGLAEFVPETFVGVYTNENDGKKYLVTVSDGEWKSINFTSVP